jgi:hypothetical protein
VPELAVFIRQWIKSYANGRLVSPLEAAHRATPNVENLLVIVLSTIKSKEKCIKILVMRSLVNEFGIPLLRRHGVNLSMQFPPVTEFKVFLTWCAFLKAVGPKPNSRHA